MGEDLTRGVVDGAAGGRSVPRYEEGSELQAWGQGFGAFISWT